MKFSKKILVTGILCASTMSVTAYADYNCSQWKTQISKLETVNSDLLKLRKAQLDIKSFPDVVKTTRAIYATEQKSNELYNGLGYIDMFDGDKAIACSRRYKDQLDRAKSYKDKSDSYKRQFLDKYLVDVERTKQNVKNEISLLDKRSPEIVSEIATLVANTQCKIESPTQKELIKNECKINHNKYKKLINEQKATSSQIAEAKEILELFNFIW